MFNTIGGEEGGEFKGVASGTLPSGKPVVVNADGTVAVVSSTAVSQALGSAEVFESATVEDSSSAYDSHNERVVIVYRDGDNNDYGTAIVGTVNSNNTITYGTAVVFNSASTEYTGTTFDSSNNKIVISFRDGGDSGKSKAIVGTVDSSDNSISFGSEATISSGNSEPMQAISFDSSANKVVVAYRDNNNSNRGTAAVGTVSGTSISFGTPVVFETGAADKPAIAYDSNANRHVIFYHDGGNSDYPTAIVGAVSGTSISFGTAVVLQSNGASGPTAIVYDSDAQKLGLFYLAQSEGKAAVGTVDPSDNSITINRRSFAFESGAIKQVSAVYHEAANKIVVAYSDDDDNDRGKIALPRISGTDMLDPDSTMPSSGGSGSPIQYESGQVQKAIGTAYDSVNKKVVIVYSDDNNSNNGTSIVFTPAFDDKNLTSENYIGMSRGVAFQTGSADATGSEAEFITTMGNEISNAVYDPDSNKVILAYSDSDNSTRGTAIVGTVSGTSISFGTAAVFNAGTTEHIGITYDTTNDKVVIVYKDAGNSNYGTAIVGTVSGTDISFGSEAVYNSATSQYNAAAFDTNTGKVVIAYKDADASVQSRVGTVSGTDISFGTEVQVISNGTYVQAVFDSNSNKVVVVYRDGSNSNYGTARVGTVSGTDISFGTAAVFASSSTEDVNAGFDSTNNKIVISYKDGGDSDKGKVVVGTVSGTDISFGSVVTFHNASTGTEDVVYNSNSGKVFLFYKNSSGIGKVVSGTVSGTAVGSLSSEFTFHNGSTNVPFMVYDVASTNIVVAYRDGGDSNKGKAVVFKPDNIATTRGEIADGVSASIGIIGSVSDNQIGLTAGQQYFVQTDGTVGETADNPSVLAGTAISATEILVKT